MRAFWPTWLAYAFAGVAVAGLAIGMSNPLRRTTSSSTTHEEASSRIVALGTFPISRPYPSRWSGGPTRRDAWCHGNAGPSLQYKREGTRSRRGLVTVGCPAHSRRPRSHPYRPGDRPRSFLRRSAHFHLRPGLDDERLQAIEAGSLSHDRRYRRDDGDDASRRHHRAVSRCPRFQALDATRPRLASRLVADAHRSRRRDMHRRALQIESGCRSDSRRGRRRSCGSERLSDNGASRTRVQLRLDRQQARCGWRRGPVNRGQRCCGWVARRITVRRKSEMDWNGCCSTQSSSTPVSAASGHLGEENSARGLSDRASRAPGRWGDHKRGRPSACGLRRHRQTCRACRNTSRYLEGRDVGESEIPQTGLALWRVGGMVRVVSGALSR